jgi:hypothetical protein
MEHIEVTADMHDRIMSNLGEIDSVKKESKPRSFKAYRKYISIAACLIFVLAGTFVVYHLTREPQTQVTPNIVEYGSLSELSTAVGFEVKEVTSCPFEAQQVQYIGYGKELAQIVYTGEDNTLMFRMSQSREDISGDYNEYSDVKDYPENDFTVTIKGNQGTYYLAVWKYGGYSYSLSISGGLSQDEILKAVLSVQ